MDAQLGHQEIAVNQKTTSLRYQASGEPTIWVEVVAHGKSLYFTVLADLGQSPGPNLLSHADLLQKYTKNFPSKSTANAKVGPATQTYDGLKAQTRPLSITPSVMYQQYIGEVPVRKSIGSLIIRVMIADLVFLQAL